MVEHHTLMQSALTALREQQLVLADQQLALQAALSTLTEQQNTTRLNAEKMFGVQMRMIEVGKQRPLARGGYEETPGLVRFNGPAPWSLAEDVPKLQRFFQARFGRSLPISAHGQTPLHDRMGFDHRNALDVALDPSSSDGRAFMEYLRSSGIPFIAAWGAIPGAASGAHIHVGQPSPRLVGRR